MKTLVVIPTYNESENIQALVPAVMSKNLDVDILVVDDNSPDGTGNIVREMQKNNPRLHLLSRPGKQGLGKAYIAGFRWAMDQGYEGIVEMDADFSHRPEDLGPLIETMKKN